MFTEEAVVTICKFAIGVMCVLAVIITVFGWWFNRSANQIRTEDCARSNPKVGDRWFKFGGKSNDTFYGEVVSVDVNPFRVTLMNGYKDKNQRVILLNEFQKLIDSERLFLMSVENEN